MFVNGHLFSHLQELSYFKYKTQISQFIQWYIHKEGLLKNKRHLSHIFTCISLLCGTNVQFIPEENFATH